MNHGSALEYALLGLLKQEPRSGYDLRKVFATTPMRHFSDSPGSIYPALRRLQAREWLNASAEKGSARQRQVFRVTPAGDRALINWLRQPLGRDDIIWRLDELILRFALLDGSVDRDTTLHFLGELERELAAYTRELSEHAETFGAAIAATTGGLAFQNGIQQYEAHLAWAKGARDKLTRES